MNVVWMSNEKKKECQRTDEQLVRDGQTDGGRAIE